MKQWLLLLVALVVLSGCSTAVKREPLTTLPAFETKTIFEEPATNELFKRSKLTLVNIWGTYCGPCRDEMPVLQKLHEKWGDDVQIVGIVTDGEENDITALQMLKEMKITYPNLMPTTEMKKNIFSHFKAIPVSFFVDENGKIVSDNLIGSRDEAGFEAIMKQSLKSLKQ